MSALRTMRSAMGGRTKLAIPGITMPVHIDPVDLALSIAGTSPKMEGMSMEAVSAVVKKLDEESAVRKKRALAYRNCRRRAC